MNPIRWDLGDGVVVRTYTPDDARELFELIVANRDRLRPWMPWEPTTREVLDVRSYIERCLASESDVEGNGIWVDGRIAGGIGLSIDIVANEGEVGYWIDGAHEGRGIVTRGSRRFVGFGFDELGLHRIQLHAAVGNVRSRAVAERLGMRLEGVHRGAQRVAGGYLDMAVYAILEDEWRAQP